MSSSAPEFALPVPRVCAVVVLYYAEPHLLQRLVESALGQVETIALIDNTPSVRGANAYVELAQSHGEQVTYIALGKNLGIAEAQNVGIQDAINSA